MSLGWWIWALLVYLAVSFSVIGPPVVAALGVTAAMLVGVFLFLAPIPDSCREVSPNLWQVFDRPGLGFAILGVFVMWLWDHYAAAILLSCGVASFWLRWAGAHGDFLEELEFARGSRDGDDDGDRS